MPPNLNPTIRVLDDGTVVGHRRTVNFDGFELTDNAPAGEVTVAARPATYRETFGWDTSTGTSAYYVSFGPFIGDTAFSTGQPRSSNVWRSPIAGTISRLSVVCEDAAGLLSFAFYETDGSTPRGSAVSGTPTSFALGALTGYQLDLAPSVSVAEGDLLCLVVDPTTTVGEVVAWMEVTPS